MTLLLKGQCQSGKNRILTTRTGHRYPPKRFASWRNEWAQQLQGQFQEQIAWPVEISVDYTPSDLRTRDIDGMLSALQSVLVYAGVLKDDGLVRGIGYWHEHPLDRTGAGVRVTLTKLGGL